MLTDKAFSKLIETVPLSQIFGSNAVKGAAKRRGEVGKTRKYLAERLKSARRRGKSSPHLWQASDELNRWKSIAARESTDGLFARLTERELLRGGKADRKKPGDFSKKQLQAGIRVEREHTRKLKLAKEIAMDHLQEIPDYYTRLGKMERKAEKRVKESSVAAAHRFIALAREGMKTNNPEKRKRIAALQERITKKGMSERSRDMKMAGL